MSGDLIWNHIYRVVEVVEETFKGHSVRLFGQKKEGVKKIGGASLHLPKIRKNPLIEIIGTFHISFVLLISFPIRLDYPENTKDKAKLGLRPFNLVFRLCLQ